MLSGNSKMTWLFAAFTGTLGVTGILVSIPGMVSVDPKTTALARFDRACTEQPKNLNDAFAGMSKIDGKVRVPLPAGYCAEMVKAKKAAAAAPRP